VRFLRTVVRTCTACCLASTVVAPSEGAAQAQEYGVDTVAIRVYLITVGQGGPYWTRFGHNALWIHDRERGSDLAYNWGLFDFTEPGFLRGVTLGNPRYWMAGFELKGMLAAYRWENRSIDIQELALSPDAARSLRDFVEWNARPENRGYRYDYYRDNCSTRVRDALDRVLSGQIRAATDTGHTGETYRRHTKRLLVGAASFSMFSFLLGNPADRPISRWDEMFVPMLMRDHLRRIRVRDEAGASVPLVRREWRAFTAQRPAERRTPPNDIPAYTIIGVVLAAVIVALASVRGRDTRARRAGASLAATWSVLAGLAGAAALGAWAFTRHTFMYENENVLQLTPLSLALAVFIPLAARPNSPRARAWIAFALAIVIVALSLFGLAAQRLAGFDQSNGEIIGLALPLHAATVFAVLRLIQNRTSLPSSADR
jgi:hypothetical protein